MQVGWARVPFTGTSAKSTVEVSRSKFGAAQMLIAQLTTSGEVAGKKQGERRPRPTDAQLLLAQASNAISAEVNLVEAMRGAGPYEGSRHDEWPLSRGWIRRLLGTGLGRKETSDRFMAVRMCPLFNTNLRDRGVTSRTAASAKPGGHPMLSQVSCNGRR